MKRIAIVAAALTIAFGLSGCTGGPGVGAMLPWLFPQQSSSPEPLISETWNQASDLKASTIVDYLRYVHYCEPQASDFATPDPATDFGKAWAADQIRTCQDYATVADQPGGCQLNYSASVGKDNLFDPKRSLVYEDSMSVLLLYGQNWQLEMSPARGAQDDLDVTKKNCANYVQKLIETIGGNVTTLGQYQ